MLWRMPFSTPFRSEILRQHHQTYTRRKEKSPAGQTSGALVLRGQAIEVFLKVIDGNIEVCEIPFQQGKEHTSATVYLIIGVQDAAIVSHQKLSDGRRRALMCLRNGSVK